ncbi:MAG: cytochrome b/b6 domain-containing protein [Pseudomonadota bacterium]
METETIRYVKIWSGWLRLAHWLIAGGVLFELASGWALAHDAIDPGFWYDWHIMIGQLTALAALLRVILLFVPGSSHWRALLPNRTDRQAMAQMLKFYLSLARTPLPAWYAHNPVWKPFYALNHLVLVACVASGFLHGTPWRLFGQAPDTLHTWLGVCLGLFAIAHGIAVFLHDLKGDGALVSAMISGARYFHVNRAGEDAVFGRRIQVEVDIETLGRRQRTDQNRDRPG